MRAQYGLQCACETGTQDSVGGYARFRKTGDQDSYEI
jgi:hypothetical protein